MPVIKGRKSVIIDMRDNGDLGDCNHKDYITPLLRPFAIPIGNLIPDPINARIHPEDNKEAIKESLKRFGQLKPIVVHVPEMIVLAGNGTLEAAKELGWKYLAAVKVEMNQVDAVGYSIADNRTSELGRWDWQRLQTAEKFQREHGMNIIGFSGVDLDILRSSEFFLPPLDDDTGGLESGLMTVRFTREDARFIAGIIAHLRTLLSPEESKGLSEAQAITTICYLWKEAEEEIERLRKLANEAIRELENAKSFGVFAGYARTKLRLGVNENE